MERIQMTQVGYDRLMEKLEDLKGRGRRDVADDLEEARSHGDLRENAGYDAAKEKQGMLEAQIRYIESQLGIANVVDITKQGTDRVMFGLIVEFENINTEAISKYQIVSEIEADLKEKRISVTAPIIRPLIGHMVGDIVEVELSSGTLEIEILSIQRPS
jgi:transcription elongation factor GreA